MDELVNVTESQYMDDSLMEAQKQIYETLTLREAESYIAGNLVTAARVYVANGYFLKRIRDDRLYEEDGYPNFESYVRDRYDKDRGWASKCIKVNSKLSVGGDSPYLDSRYQDYTTYQLVELAYMTEEQREQAPPEMPIREMKALRSPKDVPYYPIEGQMDLAADFPDVLPAMGGQEEPQVFEMGVAELFGDSTAVVTSQQAGQVQEEMLPLPQSQSFTVNVSDLFPEETVAISQQTQTIAPGECYHRPGYPCAMTLQQAEMGAGGQCGSGCCWDCEKHGGCNIECYSSAQRPEPTKAEDRATYVHEQHRQQKEYLYPLAKQVIREHKDWFLKDYMGRVLNVETSELQLKELLGANNEGRQYDFTLDGKSVSLSLFADRIDVIYFDSNEVLHPEGTCEWFYFAAAVQAMWNEVVLEDEGQEAVDSEADKTEETEDNDKSVIDAEFSEVEEREDGELTDLQIARQELERAERLLRGFLNELPDESNIHIRRMKIKTAALESYVRALDDSEDELPKPEQPELPLLKNNDQRAAFVDAYEAWPLWIETMETGERYYRYDLADGTSMVVKVYHAMLFDYSVAGLNYEERFSEGWGKQEYYLLRTGKFFKDCEANRSALIEKLKEIQKKSDMPEKGTKMYSVHEHLYYVKGRSGPLTEYCVYEGIVKEIRKVGYTELCLIAKDADRHEKMFFYPTKEIGKSVFYTPGEAALLAREKTEQYEETWARILKEPLRRSWEHYLVD